MGSTGVVRGQNDGLCKAWQGNLCEKVLFLSA